MRKSDTGITSTRNTIDIPSNILSYEYNIFYIFFTIGNTIITIYQPVKYNIQFSVNYVICIHITS